MNNSPDHLNPSSRFDEEHALSRARRDAVTRQLPTGSVIERLEKSADAPTGVRFVGQSIAPVE
jgi:hypothetical protein